MKDADGDVLTASPLDNNTTFAGSSLPSWFRRKRQRGGPRSSASLTACSDSTGGRGAQPGGDNGAGAALTSRPAVQFARTATCNE